MSCRTSSKAVSVRHRLSRAEGFRDELGRNWSQLTEQYEIERALAQQLKTAPRAERPSLYRSLYEELLSRVPHHPMAPRSLHRAARGRSVLEEAQMLSFFTGPDSVLLEIGSGDLSLSREMAGRVKTVIAADITDAYHTADPLPDNLRPLVTDGVTLDIEPGTVDAAFSNQLLEHFHPEDVEEHVRNVYRALKAGAPYICVTPHRFAGPHDISKYFDDTATGFHIKEYTIDEVTHLLRRSGFCKVRVLFSVRHRYIKVPAAAASAVELIVTPLPRASRKALVGSRHFQRLFGIRVLAVKGP